MNLLLDICSFIWLAMRVHPDPFDRLLAAQAIESGMTILSPDAPLSLLGASRVW